MTSHPRLAVNLRLWKFEIPTSEYNQNAPYSASLVGEGVEEEVGTHTCDNHVKGNNNKSQRMVSSSCMMTCMMTVARENTTCPVTSACVTNGRERKRLANVSRAELSTANLVYFHNRRAN